MNKKVCFILLIVFLGSCTTKDQKADAYGNFETDEIIISSEIPGKLLSMDLMEGAILKKGQIVAIIDSLPLVLNRNKTEAQKAVLLSKFRSIASEMDILEEQKNTLKNELNRTSKLFDEDAATEKQYDQIKGEYQVLLKKIQSVNTQYSSLQAEMNVIEKSVEQVNDQISRCRIINPTNGVVLRKYAESFEITAAGKALYKIADISYLNLKAYISGAQLSSVKIGQKVTVFIDGLDNNTLQYEGTLIWISDQAEFTPRIIQTKEERVNLVYAIKVRVKNDGTLKIGMPAEVVFKHK